MQYYKLVKSLHLAGAPGFVQIRGGKNLTSKKRWKSYGSLAVDKTGVYNLNASFEANVIKFITFEWGKDGIVDALCDFQIEVLESMEVVELDIGFFQFNRISTFCKNFDYKTFKKSLKINKILKPNFFFVNIKT